MYGHGCIDGQRKGKIGECRGVRGGVGVVAVSRGVRKEGWREWGGGGGREAGWRGGSERGEKGGRWWGGKLSNIQVELSLQDSRLGFFWSGRLRSLRKATRCVI